MPRLPAFGKLRQEDSCKFDHLAPKKKKETVYIKRLYFRISLSVMMVFLIASYKNNSAALPSTAMNE